MDSALLISVTLWKHMSAILIVYTGGSSHDGHTSDEEALGIVIPQADKSSI
jgi:hypothetical protein